MMDKIIIAGYGIFLLTGAYFGFKAGSRVSLIMGLTTGLLTFLGLYLTFVNAKNAYLFLTALAGLLTCVFIMRFIKTQQFMPSGMLMLISALFAVFCAFRFARI